MRTVRRVLWLASAFVFMVIVPMGGQQRSALSPAVAPFVSVDAPIVALTHVRVVDGTGAPPREDQRRGLATDDRGETLSSRRSRCRRT